jgi:cyanophycinase-like exopeptidase
MALGKIAFLGSGETARAGGVVFERLARDLGQPLRIAILETPAGFEPNSELVACRVADFMACRLQNYVSRIDVVPARKRGTHFSPDNPAVLGRLARANFIFMGPGSPTYAIRQLQGSLAWDLVRARHRLGATLALASSATIAVGAWGLPVYEVYKVGEDVHSVAGLNLFGDFGLQLSLIPHWNNAEGGDEVDTSRCFVGMERFATWCSSLPADNTTVGLDEHTWLVVDLEAGACEVGGVSTVSIIRGSEQRVHPAGTRFPLTELGAVQLPASPEIGISPQAWHMVHRAAQNHEVPPCKVLQLVDCRKRARENMDWGEADRLRDRIAELGWSVQDTSAGQNLVKQ